MVAPGSSWIKRTALWYSGWSRVNFPNGGRRRRPLVTLATHVMSRKIDSTPSLLRKIAGLRADTRRALELASNLKKKIGVASARSYTHRLSSNQSKRVDVKVICGSFVHVAPSTNCREALRQERLLCIEN